MAGIALYQISNDYRKALDFDLETEADAEALTELLGEITDRFETKAEAVVAYKRNIEAEAEAYKAESKRLAEEAKKRERRAKALEGYLECEMKRCNLTECRAGLTVLKFVKNPWSVDVFDEAAIPDEYARFKREIDKVKLAAALKANIPIAGARLTQGERLKIA